MKTRSIIFTFLLLGSLGCTKGRFDVPSPAAPLQEEGGVPISVGLSDILAEVETRSMDDNTLDTLIDKGFYCTCLKGTYDAASGCYRYSTVFDNVEMTYNSYDCRFYPPETYYYPAASDDAGHNTVMVFGASYPNEVTTSFSGDDGQMLLDGDWHDRSTWEGRGFYCTNDGSIFDCTVRAGSTAWPQFLSFMPGATIGHKLVGTAEIKCHNSFNYNWRFYLGDANTGNSVSGSCTQQWKRYAVEWTATTNNALVFEPFMPDWNVTTTPLIMFSLRDAGVYDLTAIYGAGNEPTAEEFLNNIGSTSFYMYSDVILEDPATISFRRPVQIIPNRTFTSTSDLTWGPAGATASFDAAAGYATVTSTGTGGYFAAHNWAQRVAGHIYLGVAEVMLPSQPSGSSAQVFLGDNYSNDRVTITSSNSFRRYVTRWTANSSSDPIFFEVFRYSAPSGSRITAYVRNAYLVDLTATFGAGNEPTAEEFLRDYPGAWYDYNTSPSTVSITGIRGAQDYLGAQARGTVSSFISTDPALQFNHGLARLKLTVRSASDVYTVRLKRIRFYRHDSGTFYHFYDASGSWPGIYNHMEYISTSVATVYDNPDGLILSTLGVEPLGYIPLISLWSQQEQFPRLSFDWSVSNGGATNDYTKTISIGGWLTPYQAGKSYNYSLTLGGEAAAPSIDINPEPAQDSTGSIIDF